MKKDWKILNRDVIKYIAMLTMLLNHIANVFLVSGTFLREAMVDIGYFTAPTMCYFLVEGYRYTRSKKKYALRLLVFAVLSQIPFSMALFGKVIQLQYLNMLFTLFFCFLLLVVKEYVINPSMQGLLYLVLIFATTFCDWAIAAAVYVLLFAYADGSAEKLKQSCGAAVLLFALMMWSSDTNVLTLLGGCLAVAASGAVILCLYNGERAQKGQRFSKYFFYLFYPMHLLVLGILRMS